MDAATNRTNSDTLNEVKINAVTLIQTKLPKGLEDTDQRILAAKIEITCI